MQDCAKVLSYPFYSLILLGINIRLFLHVLFKGQSKCMIKLIFKINLSIVLHIPNTFTFKDLIKKILEEDTRMIFQGLKRENTHYYLALICLLLFIDKSASLAGQGKIMIFSSIILIYTNRL